MYVWSKRLVIGLLVAFGLLEGIFFFMTGGGAESQLHVRTTQWITVNYILLVIWIFVWMIDQARVRGKNVWVWLLPYIICPASDAGGVYSHATTSSWLSQINQSRHAIGQSDRACGRQVFTAESPIMQWAEPSQVAWKA